MIYVLRGSVLVNGLTQLVAVDLLERLAKSMLTVVEMSLLVYVVIDRV